MPINNILRSKKFFTVLYLAAAILCVAGLSLHIYDNWNVVRRGLRVLFNSPFFLLTEVLLMLANFSLEAMRWRVLDHDRSAQSFGEYFRIIFQSTALSIGTPAGLGEHIGKIKSSNNRGLSLFASVLGSAMQTSVIVAGGVFGLVFCELGEEFMELVALAVAFALLAFAVLFFFRRTKVFLSFVKLINKFSRRDVIIAYALNALRYLVFCFQLYLVFVWNNFSVDANLMWLIFVYYLLVTVVPSAGLADIGIRGSVAVAVLGAFYGGQSVAVAAMLVWIVNRLIPSVIGLLCLTVDVHVSR